MGREQRAPLVVAAGLDAVGGGAKGHHRGTLVARGVGGGVGGVGGEGGNGESGAIEGEGGGCGEGVGANEGGVDGADEGGGEHAEEVGTHPDAVRGIVRPVSHDRHRVKPVPGSYPR